MSSLAADGMSHNARMSAPTPAIAGFLFAASVASYCRKGTSTEDALGVYLIDEMHYAD